jgi:hypothetical protein
MLFFGTAAAGFGDGDFHAGKKKRKRKMPTEEITWALSGHAASARAGGWKMPSLRLF